MEKKILELTKEHFGEKFKPKHEPYLGVYEISEWTFGEREDIAEQSSIQKKDKKTGEVDVKMQSSKFRTLTMVKCTKTAPFVANYKNVRDMPIIIAEWLYSHIDELNDDDGLTVEDLKKFD